jgi:hypothetical protein
MHEQVYLPVKGVVQPCPTTKTTKQQRAMQTYMKEALMVVIVSPLALLFLPKVKDL